MLIHWRRANLRGTHFSKLADGRLVKTVGHAYDFGGPLSGPKAVHAWVNAGEPNFTYIRFTQPVQTSGSCALPFGMTVEIDGVGATITAIVLQDNDTVMRLTVSPAIDPGDVVVWRYVEGDPACLLDEDGDPIGDQGPLTASNDLVLAGDLILLESGGTNIFLLEDDTDGSSGIELEMAGAPTYSPEVQAVLSRMSALSQGEIDAIETFVDGLVSDGIWSLLDEFYCFALNGTDWLTGFKQFTATTSGVVARTNDGASIQEGFNYIRTGALLNTLANYRVGNAECGVFCQDIPVDWGTATFDLFAVQDSSNIRVRWRHQGNDTNILRNAVNSATQVNNTLVYTGMIGKLLSLRDSGGSGGSLIDGIALPSAHPGGSAVPANLDIWLFSGNDEGVPQFTGKQSTLSAFYVGAAVNTAQFNTRVRQLLISLGVSGVTP